MFILRIWINRIRQIDQRYRDRDDALRSRRTLGFTSEHICVDAYPLEYPSEPRVD